MILWWDFWYYVQDSDVECGPSLQLYWKPSSWLTRSFRDDFSYRSIQRDRIATWPFEDNSSDRVSRYRMKWPFVTYLFQFGGGLFEWGLITLSSHQAADTAGLMQNLLYSSVFGSRPGDWVATTARTFSWRVVWTQTANHTPHTSKMNPFPQEFLTVFTSFCVSLPCYFYMLLSRCALFARVHQPFHLLILGIAISPWSSRWQPANRGVVFFSCPVGILVG